MSKRAMSDAAKAQKAEAILDCAAALFLASDYETVTMAKIAKTLRLSNGILFVYFPTKQTLFFSLLMRAYDARVQAMAQLLLNKQPRTLQALFDLILSDLELQLENTLYIRLEAIRAAILEKNIEAERFITMKVALYHKMHTLAQQIAIPGVISALEILDIFHIQTALIEGFNLASATPAPLQQQLSQNGLDAFVHDFKRDTLRTMRLYLQALKAEKNTR